jgi:hypothetical protein
MVQRLEKCAQAYVAFEILGYLGRLPGARDTLDGIVEWWLTNQRHRIGKDMVASALDQLVRAGSLTRLSTPSGAIVYSASPVTTAEKE